MTARVHLKSRKAKPFWYGEPWVFDGSIEGIKGKAVNGDIVDVCDDQGRRIGAGFYNGASVIRVRLCRWGEGTVDESLIRQRIHDAVRLRRETLRLDERTNAYRLVHAEGDGLPGLIVDKLGDVCVLQIDVLGMRRFRDLILNTLDEAMGPAAIIERVSRVARRHEGLGDEVEEGLIAGSVPDDLEIIEDGVRFHVDPISGQKTGFYADQRENRMLLRGLAAGREVLDCFTYTGAFALSLTAHGGATSAVAIDSSKPALATALENGELNGVNDRIEWIAGNVLRVLDHMAKEGRTFDMVILDPPKLAPTRSDLRKAVKLYDEINRKGLRVTAPGGILATNSCSQAVSRQELDQIASRAAFQEGRTLQRIAEGSQGADHPIRIPHLESAYLKMQVYTAH